MAGVPNPGSDEALAQGCICAVLDNFHGRGHLGVEGQFVITVGCPVHHPHKKERKRQKKRGSSWYDG